MIAALRRLYRGETNVDFPKLWRRWLVVSAVVLIASVISLFVRGLNLGVQFEGGSSWEVSAPGVSVGEARDALRPVGAGDATIQFIGSDTLRVRSDITDPEDVADVQQALADLAGATVDDVALESISASWSSQVTEKAVRALVWFFIVVALYITVRLEWKMAIGALVAVAHDIIVSVGIYSIFHFEVTPATVIAFLTIMGYSLYDTIVVYDKVREVSGRVGATGKYTYTEMMNLSLNQVLMRSINTTITSVLPVLAMLIIGSFVLGASTLQEFSIALLIGLLVGGYSSLFVASWVVVKLKEREPSYRELAERLGASGDGATRVVDRDDAALGTAARARRAPTAAPAKTDRPAPTGAIPPRPRKKKRR